MARERLVAPQAAADAPPAGPDVPLHATLRPERFDAYVGQRDLIRKLRITVEAARRRGEPVDHALFHGPPGLGKTTLAHVIANEIGTRAHVTTGPALTKPADLVGIVTGLGANDVLFIDEIHRLSRVVEEYLYGAMEDYKVDVTLDTGPHARVVTLDVKPFTLVGATTRLGLLTAPMRARFGLVEHLLFYPPEDLLVILKANASKLGVAAQAEALQELAHRSRGTPRVANRLLRRVRDFATVEGDGTISLDLCRKSLELEGIDAIGLDALDRSFLRAIIDVYNGGPAGIEAVAATLGEERDTLEDVIEPYLLQQGLLARTRQGRRVTKKAYDHLGVTPPVETDEGALF
jgi:Holliday junction DNA helicase RuvB